jgi:hypothetical protein
MIFCVSCNGEIIIHTNQNVDYDCERCGIIYGPRSPDNEKIAYLKVIDKIKDCWNWTSQGYYKDGIFESTGTKYGSDGYDIDGYDKEGYNKEGYNKEGYNKSGYDKDGYDKEGYNKSGYDQDGIFESTGTKYGSDGYDIDGYDIDGYNKSGYDIDGYNKDGYDESGYDQDGYYKDGYNAYGYNPFGYNKSGYNRNGYNRNGYDVNGYHVSGFHQDTGIDRRGFNIHGIFAPTGTKYDSDGYDKQGYDKEQYDKRGYDKEGYNREGFDCVGWDKNGWNLSLRNLPWERLVSLKRPSNFYDFRQRKKELSFNFMNKTKHWVGTYYSFSRYPDQYVSHPLTQTIIKNKNEINGISPAQNISKLMYDYLINNELGSFDCIIPVANHNQNSEQISGAVSIGQELSKLLKIECHSDALEKILNIKARTIPKSQKYEFWDNNDLYIFSGIHNIRDKKILLVDDIITHDYTISQCIYQLGNEGPKDITVLCAGRTKK